jgi:hypothetical protein
MVKAEPADQIRQWVRRIGDHQDDRVGRRLVELGEDVPVHARVYVEQSEPAGRVAAIRRPTSLLIAPAVIMTRPAPARSA